MLGSGHPLVTNGYPASGTSRKCHPTHLKEGGDVPEAETVAGNPISPQPHTGVQLASGSSPYLFGPEYRADIQVRQIPKSTTRDSPWADGLQACSCCFRKAAQDGGQHIEHQQPPTALVAVMQPLDVDGDERNEQRNAISTLYRDLLCGDAFCSSR